MATIKIRQSDAWITKSPKVWKNGAWATGVAQHRAAGSWIGALGTQVLTLLGSGGWTWFNEPAAICYQGTKRQLYVGGLGQVAGGDVLIYSLDLDSGARKAFVLADNFEGDDHDNPAILVRPDGRLIAFYSTHGTATGLRYRISTNPEDVSAWGAEQGPIDTLTSYANPFLLPAESNRIYLFYRHSYNDGSITGEKPHVRWSDDSGATWSAASPVFYGAPGLRVAGGTGQRPYVRYRSNGSGRIHFVASGGHPRSTDEMPAGTCHIYHWYMEGGNFYKSDGTLIRSVASLSGSGPLAATEVTKVYDATTDSSGGDGNAWPYSIELDTSGRPVVTFGAFAAADDNRYWYARWTGSAWDKHQFLATQGRLPTDTAEPQYTGLAVVDPRDTRRMFVSHQTGVTAVWEMEVWTTIDGGANWATTPLTVASGRKHYRPYVPRNWLSGAPSVLWCAGVYTSFTSYAAQIMALDSPHAYPDTFAPFSETFTGTDGTLITSRPSDSGHTWSNHPEFPAGTGAVIQTNRFRPPDAGGYEVIVPGPVGPALTVRGTVVLLTDNNVHQVGVGVRCSEVARTSLELRYESNGDKWEVFKVLETATTSLGSYTAAVGAFVWTITATGLVVNIAGVDRITVPATSYPEIPIAGIISAFGLGAATSATGLRLDDLSISVP